MRIYRILRGFGRQMSRANVNAYAASTAFFLFLSLIPMLMLICSILPYTPIKKSDIITAVTLLPQTLSPLLTSLIQSIYDSTFGVMSIAAIVTVWSAGKGVLALMRGLNAMNGVVEDRNYVLQRIIASFYLIIFLITIIFLLIVMVFGNLFAGYDSAACPPDGRSVCPSAAFQGAVFLVHDDSDFCGDVYLYPQLQAEVFTPDTRRCVFRNDLEYFFLGIFHVYPAVQRVRYVWEPDDYRYCNALALFLFLFVPDRGPY